MTQTIIETTPKEVKDGITYAEFLQQYQDCHAEWLGGEVIELMTASDKHQDIVRWLVSILSIFIEMYDLGWVRPAPLSMYMPQLQRGREPDVMFVTKARLDIVQQANLSEAADLVVEIVSPESVGETEERSLWSMRPPGCGSIG
jgi:Uma2 family endonuclease